MQEKMKKVTPNIGLYNPVDSARIELESKFPSFYYVQVLSNRLCVYNQSEGRSIRTQENINSLANLEKSKNLGTISTPTCKYIRKILDTWLFGIIHTNELLQQAELPLKHHPIFVTLTLSAKQKHDDNFIKRYLLGAFLKQIIYNEKSQLYFWRAESQKNGNIHFHLILDTYWHFKDIQQRWNAIQARYGYLDEFKLKYNHDQPNSTDVKGIKDVKNFVNYVIKYAVKSSDSRLINGRLWGMSDKLREISTLVLLYDTQIENELLKFQSTGKFTRWDGAKASILFSNTPIDKILPENYISKLYKTHCKTEYDKIYNCTTEFIQCSDDSHCFVDNMIEESVELEYIQACLFPEIQQKSPGCCH